MEQSKEFCLGDGLRFSDSHKHHAQGYCHNEYRKMLRRTRPKIKKAIPPIPRICKGDGFPFDNDDHRHYALGRCKYTYYRLRKGFVETGYTCVKCPKYFPDELPNPVRVNNGLCTRCAPLVDAAIERGQQSAIEAKAFVDQNYRQKLSSDENIS